MTTQLDIQTDTERETHRETQSRMRQTAQDAAGTPAVTPAVDGGHPVHHVIESSIATARRLADEAAQIETPGFKLLLKAMAERHMRYARELARHTQDPAVDVPPAASAADEIQLGMNTLQTSMTLQREGRQELVLGELVADERHLLDKYEKAINAQPPAPIRDLLAAQKQRLSAAYDNLRRAADGRSELVARIYENHEDGERAITSLRAQGIGENDIDVLDGRQLRERADQAPKVNRTRPTVIAAAIGGGVVGLIIGVAWWFLLMAGADAADATVAEPMTVGPVTLIVSSVIFGALIASVFGWFIGRNKAEDDEFVTQQSLQEGELLIAVYVPKDRVPQVEQTLHVHHGRELPV